MIRRARAITRRIRTRAEERSVRAFMGRLADHTRRTEPLPSPGIILARALGRPRHRLVQRSLLPIFLFESLVALIALVGFGTLVWSMLTGNEGSAEQQTFLDLGSSALPLFGAFATLLIAALSSLVSDA